MDSKPKDTYLSAFSSERRNLTDEINAKLPKLMNRIHGTDYSDRFWIIILGPYITSVISRKDFLSSGEMDLPPLFEPINAIGHPDMKKRFQKKLRHILKSYKTSKNYKPALDILTMHNDIAFGFHDPVSITNDVGAYLPDYFAPVGKKNKSKRNEAKAVAEEQDNLFYKNVIKQLPEIFVEYFDGLMDLIPLKNPSKKVFHVSLLDSFFNKLLLAKYLENGAKLHYYQHGAYYGELVTHNAHKNESAIADKFITWGWKIYDKDVPGKAYRLEKFRREYDSKNTNFIYDCLFCYPGINNKNREQFRKYTHDLATKLDKNKYKKLIARPRPNSKLPFVSHKIGFPVSKEIIIDSAKKGIVDTITQTRLVIQFTVPSTNFTECLYVDHPTIGLLNNDNPTDVVKPFYDFFLKVGVLHHDFDSLIAHLNAIDLDSWWKGVCATDEYKEFKNTFLRAV